MCQQNGLHIIFLVWSPHSSAERTIRSIAQSTAYLSRVVPGGTAVTISRPVAVAASARDLVRLGERSLWAAGRWKVGGRASLAVDFGPAHAGERYQVALAFDHKPGIPLPPAGTAHLAPDALLQLSLAGVPGLFVNFSGTLDAQGRPPSPPTARACADRRAPGRGRR